MVSASSSRGARVPNTGAAWAEAAGDDFKRRARRDRRAPFWKISRRPRRARRFRWSLRPPPEALGYRTRVPRGPRPPETISNAELAEIAERLSGRFLGDLGALGVLDRLCVLLERRSGTEHGCRVGRGRRRRFQTPSSPRSPSAFLEDFSATSARSAF